MVAPLTEQEKAAQEARQSTRPRRNLQVVGMLTIAAMLGGGALYLHWRDGSRATKPIAERSGPKPEVSEAPKSQDLKALLDKQGAAQVNPTAPTGESPIATATVTPAVTGFTPQQPGGFTPSAPNSQPSATPAMDLKGLTPGAMPYPGGTQPRMASGDPDDKVLKEASWMTSKTGVYTRNKAPGTQNPAVQRTRDGAQPDAQRDIDAALAEINKGAGDPLARLQAIRNGVGGMAGGADDKIARRQDRANTFTQGEKKESTAVVAAPSMPFLAMGTLIPAVLTRNINSDLPGQIEACVTTDVYDSSGNGLLLIPKGACAIGIYNSGVSVGQDRLQAAFTRLRYPNGAYIDLGGAPGADMQGSSGIEGDVNNHFARVFGSTLLVAMMTYGVERRIAKDQAQAQQGSSGTFISTGSTGSPGTIAAQTFAEVGKSVMDRYSSIGPTLTVKSGSRINIQVTRDLLIDPEKNSMMRRALIAATIALACGQVHAAFLQGTVLEVMGVDRIRVKSEGTSATLHFTHLVASKDCHAVWSKDWAVKAIAVGSPVRWTETDTGRLKLYFDYLDKPSEWGELALSFGASALRGGVTDPILTSAQSRAEQVLAGVFAPCKSEDVFEMVAGESGVSRNLLVAIAMTESGRGAAPWPWTLNVEGKGYYYDSREEAHTALVNFLKGGKRSIDVGPMQVNLKYHSHRFKTTWDALDPLQNVRAGASILRENYERDPSIAKAVGNYHSFAAPRANRYFQRVSSAYRMAASVRTSQEISK